MASKHTKPWKLTETEDFSSFQHWQLAAQYYFTHGDNAHYKPYFAENLSWKKATPTDTTRGLLPTQTQTAMERKEELEQLLSLIGQYAPAYCAGEIFHDSTSIASIWTIIRRYYGFETSETTFMSFLKIHLEHQERPQRLYHRMVSFIRDSLLQKGDPIKHNGVTPAAKEELSPTLERLVVLMWLEKVHPNLPDLVVQKFSYDLSCMSLKDLQPRISQALPSLLAELKNRDTGSSNAVHTMDQSVTHAVRGASNGSTSKRLPFNQNRFQNRKPPARAYCRLCAAEGRNPSHPGGLAGCDYISLAEKREMYRFATTVRQIDVVQDDFDEEGQGPLEDPSS